ncbi:PREDICTED: cell division cycle-associated protein 2-like [Eurypyga helias]|uniref:cell division cycle-associated protein 2-like n=1 Tax=Eurypyga helias TaxID=54383 RepID=UPI00052859BF|nr:PREDICTED: cell division cycle-associated protein 2-like [Eurypyga helias]
MLPWKLKNPRVRCTEEKEEASVPDLLRHQKICKVAKSRAMKASKKENLSDGNQAKWQKRTLKYTKDLQKESYHSKEDVVSCQLAKCFFDTLKGEVVGEPALPLNSKENLSERTPVSLGGECCVTPGGGTAEEKSDCGISEKQRNKPVDFATVAIAELGITQGSFTKQCLGKSPASLKYRRRSAIGVRGSPENNTLIQYLAQQRSNRQKEAFKEQVSPFKRENVRPLRDKIDAFHKSLKSVQEADAGTGFSCLLRVDGASQEGGCSQNKVPFTEERSLGQWSEKFMSDNSEADSRRSWTSSSKSDTRTCSILSLCQDVTLAEPPAALSKEWVYEQHSPIESLESVLITETGHGFRSAHIPEDGRRNVTPDLSRRRASFAEEWQLDAVEESNAPVVPPGTPQPTGAVSWDEWTGSSSHLRSILKKTPTKQLKGSTEDYPSDAVDREEGDSLAVSSCAEFLEPSQTEETERPSPEMSKKKKVTFGGALSPEIFDETLPANTPLRRGATPLRQLGLQSSSPSVRSSPTKEPLSQPNFDCSDESIEPPPELVEDPLAAEDLLPVENAEAEADKSDTIKTRSAKRKCSTTAEGTDFSNSRATNTKNTKSTKNPRKNEIQRQKNITTSATKKTQKVKHTSYGKRRKKKVKKSLYGEREIASKKPLLSPIPESPEVFSSTPNEPKANALLLEDVFLGDAKSGNACQDVQQRAVVEGRRGTNTCAVRAHSGCEDVEVGEASSSSDAGCRVPCGHLQSVSGSDHEFSDNVPDAKRGFDTPDCSQQGGETTCVEEAQEHGSLAENEKLQDLLNKGEQLTRLEFLEQQDTDVHEGAQRTGCPHKDFVRGSSPRTRSSSAIYFPPVERLEMTGNDLPVSYFNVEEILSVTPVKNDSLEPFRRKRGDSGERRVRRSMRLHKDAEREGLAWIQVPDEIQKAPPLLAPACRSRRTIGASILRESEREQNLVQPSAAGRESNDSSLADGPCERWRRKSVCASVPRDSRTWSRTQKRSITSSGYRKDRSDQKHYEEEEIPLENNI